MMLLRPEGLFPSQTQEPRAAQRRGRRHSVSSATSSERHPNERRARHRPDRRRPWGSRRGDVAATSPAPGPLDHEAVRRPARRPRRRPDIPRAAIVSIIGPNGAGKTTFFNVVAGIIDPTAGDVRVQGPVPDPATAPGLARVGPVGRCLSVFAVLVAVLLGAPAGRRSGDRHHRIGRGRAARSRRSCWRSSGRPGTRGSSPGWESPQRPPERCRRRRDRPHVPEHPAVPEHDRARERARRDAPPAAIQPHRPRGLDAAAAPRGGGSHRARARAAAARRAARA